MAKTSEFFLGLWELLRKSNFYSIIKLYRKKSKWGLPATKDKIQYFTNVLLQLFVVWVAVSRKTCKKRQIYIRKILTVRIWHVGETNVLTKHWPKKTNFLASSFCVIIKYYLLNGKQWFASEKIMGVRGRRVEKGSEVEKLIQRSTWLDGPVRWASIDWTRRQVSKLLIGPEKYTCVSPAAPWLAWALRYMYFFTFLFKSVFFFFFFHSGVRQV